MLSRLNGPRKESKLEKFISDYVKHYTAEKVELLLNERISIRPVNRSGSILLAVFWANVLQSDGNFPSAEYKYKKRPRCGPEGEEVLELIVNEEVTVRVLMTSGTVVIFGQYIYEWFTRHFQEILEKYDPELSASWTFQPTPAKTFPSSEEERVVENYTETERYLFMRLEENPDLPDLDRKLLEGDEDWIQTKGNLNLDMTLWKGPELEAQLEHVSPGVLADGLSYVYKLWLSLLDQWFHDPDVKVYMATTMLDTDLLSDMIRVYLAHAHTAKLTALYTTVLCDPPENKTISKVKKSAMDTFDKTLHNVILYKIFRNIFHPSAILNATFVAGVKGDEAGVLLTSASFHKDHMRKTSTQTVQFSKMSTQHFHAKFIDTLFENSNVATEY